MSEAYLVLQPPSVEPVTLTEVKRYLRVDFDDDDILIAGMISQARKICEETTGRAYASQQIQEIFTLERPNGGALSGPIMPPTAWYQFHEAIGGNPFGPAQYYFDLAMPPIQATRTMTVQTKVFAFADWEDYDITPPATWLDNTQEPARMYFSSPVTANFWKFVYWTGYDATYSYPLPFDMKDSLLKMVSSIYKRCDEDTESIKKQLMSRRVAEAWI